MKLGEVHGSSLSCTARGFREANKCNKVTRSGPASSCREHPSGDELPGTAEVKRSPQAFPSRTVPAGLQRRPDHLSEAEALVSPGAPPQESRPGFRGSEPGRERSGRARETPAGPSGGGRGAHDGRAWPYLPSSRRAGIIDASSKPCSPMLRMRCARRRRRGGLPASPQLWKRAAPDGSSRRPKLLPEAAVAPRAWPSSCSAQGLGEVRRPRVGGAKRRGPRLPSRPRRVLAEPGMPRARFAESLGA